MGRKKLAPEKAAVSKERRRAYKRKWMRDWRKRLKRVDNLFSITNSRPEVSAEQH